MLTMELTRPIIDCVPACPNCGRSMHLTRTTPRDGLPDQCVFKCGECSIWLTESADDRPAA